MPLDEEAAHTAGALLGKTRTKDVTDAAVAALAAQRGADVVTDDPDDIQPLLSAAGARVSVLDV